MTTHVVATEAHARALAPRLRAEDAAEVRASCGLDPLPALLDSLNASSVRVAWLVDGEVAALWGVADLGDGEGVVWLLGSEALRRHPRAFWLESQRIVAILRQHYRVLINAVDARYEAALRWARRLGFEVGEAEPFGVEGRPFHKITLRGT